MKIAVADPNEPKTEEQEDLPGVDTPAQEPAVEPAPAPADSDRVRELELENASLRGKAEAMREFANTKPADNTNAAQNAWKATIATDINILSDEDFRTKYKTEKFQATAAILEFDIKNSDTKTQQSIASVRAEQRLMAKYKDFLSVKTDVDEVVAMASAEVRQDPEKLEKLMERAYLSSAKADPVKPVAPSKEPVRRVISNFDKPTPKANEPKADSASDELPEEFRELGKSFNLTSEKERKELLSSAYIPMDLGGGLVFRDPAKGVEKVS